MNNELVNLNIKLEGGPFDERIVRMSLPRNLLQAETDITIQEEMYRLQDGPILRAIQQGVDPELFVLRAKYVGKVPTIIIPSKGYKDGHAQGIKR